MFELPFSLASSSGVFPSLFLALRSAPLVTNSSALWTEPEQIIRLNKSV